MIILGVFILIAVLILVSPIIRSLAVTISLICLAGAVCAGIFVVLMLFQTAKQNNERSQTETSYVAPTPAIRHVSQAEFNQKVEEIKRIYLAQYRQADPREAREEAINFYKAEGVEMDFNPY